MQKRFERRIPGQPGESRTGRPGLLTRFGMVMQHENIIIYCCLVVNSIKYITTQIDRKPGTQSQYGRTSIQIYNS